MTINGLPAHPLLVHGVVVLVPLTAVLLALSVCWPAARQRLGLVVPLAAAVMLALVPLTAEAGTELRAELGGGGPLVARHAQLGAQLTYWSAGVFVSSALWWLATGQPAAAWPRRSRAGALMVSKPARMVLAAVALGCAVGSVVMVYRIGDTGARAVWQR